MLELEPVFIKKFSEAADTYSKTQSVATALAELPRYLLEAFAFGGIVTFCIFLIYIDGDLSTYLTIISLYVFSGYKLLPAIQQIYSSYSQLVFGKKALDNLSRDLKLPYSKFKVEPKEMVFENQLKLDHVCFSYGDNQSLHDINLTIYPNQKIAILGESGSGKSTLINILAGLLTPSKGSITVDNYTLNSTIMPSWRRCIGYVPQNLKLFDATVAENIAFGANLSDINLNKVIKAAKLAKIHDFIMTLPNGYYALVGEDGANLSGGQKQRIAIARALYFQPKVLIFDEATSALDGQTEKEILNLILSLDDGITILFVTHKITLLDRFDRTVYLRNGSLVAD